VQFQSSSVAQAARESEHRDCCSIGCCGTADFVAAVTSFESAPMSLFLCAVMISAGFDGTGMGLRISRSIIEWNGSRLRAADQSPCGASSYLIIEAGAR
jgi:hypothetical protein